MQLTRILRLLKGLLDKAEVKERLNPGSAILVLPSGKELSRLADLAGKLCALYRKSVKVNAKEKASGKIPSSSLREALRRHGSDINATALATGAPGHEDNIQKKRALPYPRFLSGERGG